MDKRPNVGRPDVSIEPVGKSELIADVYPAPRLKAPRVSSKVTIVRGANGDVQLRVTEPRLIAIFTPLSFCWSLDLQDNAGLCARETSAVPNAERHSHLELLADHTTLYDARKIRQ